MKRAFKKFVIAYLLLTANALLAVTDDNARLTTQSLIEQQVTKLIHLHDRDALVFVTVDFADRKTQLPSTPFTVSELQINSDGTAKVRSVGIVVYTKEEEFPEKLLELIKKQVQRYGATPTIKLEPLEDVKTPQDDLAEARPRTWMAALKQSATKEPLTVLVAGSVLLLAVILLLFVLTFALRTRAGSKALDRRLGQLSTALGDMGALGGGGATNTPATQAEAAQVRGGGGPSDDTMNFGAFPVPALMALLTDAYWAKEDGYAAYVWNRIPIDSKQKILGNLPFLKSYTAYLVDVRERPGTFHQDPYYLNPLPIFQIDTEELTVLAREHAALVLQLPKLRQDSLGLSAVEMVRIMTQDDGEAVAAAREKAPDFAKQKASGLRKIARNFNLKIKSIDEEKEILATEGLTIQQKQAIPTLAWLAAQPDDKITAILNDYSAVDLATAWLGPEDVLEKLAQNLPEKKLALVKSYITNNPPSRNSATFQRLYKKGAELLADQSKETEAA